jgi:hypothetical protein
MISYIHFHHPHTEQEKETMQKTRVAVFGMTEEEGKASIISRMGQRCISKFTSSNV